MLPQLFFRQIHGFFWHQFGNVVHLGTTNWGWGLVMLSGIQEESLANGATMVPYLCADSSFE